MTMQELRAQAEKLLVLQPNLRCIESDHGIVLEGVFVLNASFDALPLYDEFEVKISVSTEFPNMIPSVRASPGNIPESFEHFLEDGSLCLGAPCDLIDYLSSHNDLSGFIMTFLPSYFYAVSYYKRYGELPKYGERSHGILGLIEAYKERYEVDDDQLLCKLLYMLYSGNEYRGHMSCPCGSGLKLRNCHGRKLIKDIQSPMSTYLKSDACWILQYFYERRNGGGKNRSTK